MDMRSLNTSLPRSPKQAHSAPDQQLLQAFKDAALTVTKLYKTAAAEQVKTRSEGYQDCLDDLLAFMDKANIGLSDGEGWRIREWATQRLDGRETHDSEDESDKERASSPVAQRNTTTSAPRHHNSASSPSKPESVAPVHIAEPIVEECDATPTTAHIQAPSGSFDFRSNISYPQEVEMADGPAMDTSVVGQSTGPAVTFARPANRAGNRSRNSRHNTRSTSGMHRVNSQASNASTGQKRKINFGEFFDLGDALNPFNGGGKRTRFT